MSGIRFGFDSQILERYSDSSDRDMFDLGFENGILEDRGLHSDSWDMDDVRIGIRVFEDSI